MSSSVCQGLQSCLEPRLVESRFLRLKLAPPNPNLSGSIVPNHCFTNPATIEPKPMPYNEEKTTNAITNNENNPNDCILKGGNQNIDTGGWSFLQLLDKPKDSAENDKVYVHPLVKRSASMLSEKSLEMCTESLGSETGCEASESSDDISLLSLETLSKPRESSVTRKMTRSSSFPPPLTSINGSNGVQVRSHREGGRLVLQAVSIHPGHCYFHAERSEGRLRLSLLKDATRILDDDSKEEEQGEVVEDDGDDEEVVYEENGVEEEAVEEEECYRGEVEIGTGKLGRPSSCKERGRGRNGLPDWEPYLVAT